MSRDHLPHREKENRQCQNGAHPKPPPHVGQLGILFLTELRGDRLDGHTANRTGAGHRADNLRVHRARVGASRGSRRRAYFPGGLLSRVSRRIRAKFLETAQAAEVPLLATIVVGASRLRRLHHHAANRISGRLAHNRKWGVGWVRHHTPNRGDAATPERIHCAEPRALHGAIWSAKRWRGCWSRVTVSSPSSESF